jgi:DNA-binding NtrC family response regulator
MPVLPTSAFHQPAVCRHLTMQSARIIVCEKTGSWATALRRALSSTTHRVHETRSLAECWRELEHSPASVIAFELTMENCEAVLEWLLDLSRRFPRARAIAMGPRLLKPFESLVREAGATHVLLSPRGVADAARLIERHVAQTPDDQLPFRQSVWSRLPWGNS